MRVEEMTGKFIAQATHCSNKHDTMNLALEVIEEVCRDLKALESCDGCKWKPETEGSDTFRDECSDCKRFHADGWEEIK